MDEASGNHAVIFRPFLPSATDVAIRALPLAHCRNTVICSAMNSDNGTESFSTMDTVKSVGSLPPAKAAYMTSTEHLKSLAPLRSAICLFPLIVSWPVKYYAGQCVSVCVRRGGCLSGVVPIAFRAIGTKMEVAATSAFGQVVTCHAA